MEVDSSIDMGIQHGQWTYIIEVYMLHGQGNAAWTRKCSMDMDIKYGYGHAAWRGNGHEQ
jgi:hypothetical protein